MVLKAILFDLDDTLILDQASAEMAFLKTCNIAYEQKGIDPQKLYQSVSHHAGELWRASPTITYCRKIGISSWEGLWARFLGNDPNLKALRAWASTYQLKAWSLALLEHGIEDFAFSVKLSNMFPYTRRRISQMFPETEDILKLLRKKYQLALVTNGAPDLQRHKIQAAQIEHFFEIVIVSGEVGIGKPNSRIFELALEQLNVEPEKAVMVGDSLSRDILGAQEVGLKGIWINRSGRESEDGIVPDIQIKALDELKPFL